MARSDTASRTREGGEGQSSETVEHGEQHNSYPMKIVEVKDEWVKVRVTMDSGAAGHVMLQTMFPRVKLEPQMES